jgi:predicted aspartyl protease
VVTHYPTTDAVSWQPGWHCGMMALRNVTKGSPFMLRRSLCLLLLVFLARCDATPQIDCNLTMVAQMPLEVQDHLLVVPVGINGKWVHLVVDSGAERTTISDAAAIRLGLPHDPRYVNRSLGIGGATTTTDVTIDRFVLGGAHLSPVTRIAVGTFNLQNVRGLHADGLLGADILLAFDMDIDVPGNQLTLYRRRLCPNARPPWPEPALEITGVKGRRTRLMLPFELDNVPGTAILDTGAQGNVLGVDMARRVGLNDQTMNKDPLIHQHGVGPGETISHLHQFRLLRIGPVAEEAPRFAVVQSDFGFGDALIGETFLQGRRVWLSFDPLQIFVSRQTNERHLDER